MASKNQERDAREARDRLTRYNARQQVHAHQVSRRRRDNIIAIVAVVIVAALAAVTQVVYFTAGPGAPAPTSSATPTPTPSATAEANVGDVPPASAAEDRDWTGELTLNTTKLGIALDGALAPQAVASVVQDITSGYYVGKTCHRVVESETVNLIQCGSNDGTGASDPDYSFGPLENVPSDGVYPAGSIAMARGSSAYSQGHQFFITTTDTTLDGSTGGYTIVGKVTSGLSDLIANIMDGGLSPTDASSPDDGSPTIATSITSVSIQ